MVGSLPTARRASQLCVMSYSRRRSSHPPPCCCCCSLRRSRLRLTQFLLRRRSRTTHPTAWRRLSNDVAACRPWHTETRKLHIDGCVLRRAWPPHRRQRRVPRRSGQHGPSPEEECLRSRPRCSEVTQLQEQGPHRKQPNWVRMCYVLFSYVTYSILMCTRYSCEYEVVGVMRSC